MSNPLILLIMNVNGGNEKCIQYFHQTISKNESHCSPRRIWKNNIKIDLRDGECEIVDCIEMVKSGIRRRSVNAVIKFPIK
jgi:hypothetical protein